MQALTIQPGRAGTLRITDMPEPDLAQGSVLVRALAMGVCGTDVEISLGVYGTAPAESERLIVGHESLGEVLEAPAGSGLSPGDLVVGIVRRRDPVPCVSCAVGEWDMCRNGLYTECGIKGRHGFGAERFRLEPEFAVRVDPALGMCGVLVEPASVLAKAWEQIERIGQRTARWEPRTVLITGAGPVGLLGAMLGAQRGLDVHVFDRVTTGPKPEMVARLGATYHAGSLSRLPVPPDIVLECTGAAPVLFDVVNRTGPGGIVCLTGISSGGRAVAVDLGMLNRTMVLENDVVFGSVNANRRHYEQAVHALARADRAWLQGLMTRRVPLARWEDAFRRTANDIKVVIDFSTERG